MVNFRCFVVWTSKKFCGFFTMLKRFSETKVTKNDIWKVISVIHDEYIFWFNITMPYSLLVHFFETRNSLIHHFRSILFTKRCIRSFEFHV